MAIDKNKYKHPNTNNPGLYAFVEVPVALLETKIPEGIPYGKKVLEPEELDTLGQVIKAEVSEPKSVREFVTHYVENKAGTKALVLLSTKQVSYGRKDPLPIEDLEAWDAGLLPYAIPETKWLTLEQYKAKLATAEYGGEGI